MLGPSFGEKVMPKFFATFAGCCLMSLMASAAVAAPYAQLSSADPQVAAAANQPAAVTMSADSADGITVAGSKVTVAAAGQYFVMAAGLWLRLNGKDVPNSNTQQSIDSKGSTAVLITHKLRV
jgi:hypothetical protein